MTPSRLLRLIMGLLTACVASTVGCLARPGATPVRVACVGDSITDGYLMPDKAHYSYPAQLGRLLGAGWEVRNFGVSGATLMRRGGYPYDQRPAYAAALAWHPDIVVVALGTNDAKAENIGQHPDDFVPSYRALIAHFRAANPHARVFLCLPPPAFPEAMGISDRVLEREIVPRIREVAGAEALPLIDLRSPLRNAAAMFPDKIHPTAAGAARIAELVYGEVMVTTQPRPAARDPHANTALIPVPRLEDDCYNWWTRHAEELVIGRQIDPDIVLIGDSITHFWAGDPEQPNRRNGPRAWAETFGSHRVLNLGFGWDRTQNVLWRLDHGEFAGLKPRLVIVNIGTNNFTPTVNARANTPAEVAEGIVAICDRVRQMSPTSQLLVMGVFPRGHRPDDPYRAPIATLNSTLRHVLAGKPNTTFLDIGRRFLAVDGSLPAELMPDGTHPSEKGYAIWGGAIVEAHLLP